MKRPTMLLHRILRDEGLQVGCTVERDFVEIQSRFEHEGMSFLTITLPTLSDALETGLSRGWISTGDFPGFKTGTRSGSLPALLQGFFIQVFKSDGSLLEHPSVPAIRAIRQVCRLYKKVELPCSGKRIKRAFERYVSNDEKLSELDFRSHVDPSLWAWVNSYLWSDLEVLSGDLYCFPGKFGSGATAEKLAFNRRHASLEWTERLEDYFPSSFHRVCYPEREFLERVTFIKEADELPARVVQVPKTLKTPRTISVEPSYMMLCQQSVAQPLMVYLESNPKTKSIRFTDQSVNRDLARIGSIDGHLSTIDLSDASDLVSYDLVSSMFSTVCPSFFEMIDACRTRRAILPDGKIVDLLKFSSMGSALCFPLEGMAFFSIVLYAMVKASGKRPSIGLCRDLTASIAVYGDDIVIPTQMVPAVCEALEVFGLKVNHTKSFSTGYFRESCGGDYYKGECVTPVYVRHLDNSSKNYKDIVCHVSSVSLANQLYMKGLWHGSQYTRDYVEKAIGTNSLPISSTEIGCLHLVSVTNSTNLRWDQTRYAYRVKGYVPTARQRQDVVSDYNGALNRAFIGAEHSRSLQNLRINGFNTPWSEDDRKTADCSASYTQSHSIEHSQNGLGIDFPRHYWECPKDGYAYAYGYSKREDITRRILEASILDLSSSVRPYALKLKRRWINVH